MDKYVIIYSSNEKQSVAFADQNKSLPSFDWYENPPSQIKERYLTEGFPQISAFPSVIEVESRFVCVAPESISQAKQYFKDIQDKQKNVFRAEKLSMIRSKRDAELKKVDIAVNDIVLGSRSDISAVLEFKEALKNVTEMYKNPDGSASSNLDGVLDVSDVLWPQMPT